MRDSKQISAMGDIMSKLNGLLGEEAVPAMATAAVSPAATGNSIARPAVNIDSSKASAMGDILRSFKSVTENIREEALTNDVLFEALQTEKTPTGVRMAEWHIEINEHPDGLGKLYNVTRDDVTIASDLRLYEAAHRLVTELNAGASITSPTIRKLLSIEARYASKLDEAIQYSRMAKKSPLNRDVALARLDEAKRDALKAKRALNDL